MARMDFEFYRNGTCCVTEMTSLEADRKDAAEEGANPDEIACHLALVTTEDGGQILSILQAMHYLEVGYNGSTQVTAIVAQIFNAGVAYGRRDVLAPLLERAEKKVL